MRALVVFAAALAACQSEPRSLEAGRSAANKHDLSPHSCDGDLFPPGVSLITRECCQIGNETWHLSPRPTVGIVHRIYGLACSIDGETPSTCAGTECVYGPCAGRNFELIGRPPAHIFHPVSDPSVCGLAATGAAPTPEPFTTQLTWDDIRSTCPYTACPGNGLPTATLSVTADASAATGSVASKPEGINLAGGGEQDFDFNDLDVKLKARPLGEHARAVFSGDCVKTGEWGEAENCKLKLGPDKQVTVTYECEPGYTCLP